MMIKYFELVEKICERHSSKLFYAVVSFCCIYIIWTAYFHGVYMSPDSASYLREAENLYYGYGFNYNGLAGSEGWFSLFPILYPFMICCVMKITTCNAYLSSKILACITMILLAIAIKKNTKKALFFAPIFLNFGFIWCHLITLSESLFMLFLSLAVFSLNEFQEKTKCFFQCSLKLLFFCICAFLTRYFGLFFAFVLLLFSMINFVKWRKLRDRLFLNKFFYLISINIIFVTLCISYFFLNNQMSGFASGGKRFVFTESYLDLTLDLVRALFDEIYGLFGNLIHGVIFFTGNSLIIDVITVICVFVFLISLYRLKMCIKCISKLSKVFFITGLVYYIVFVVYRYTSTMDHFQYRFFIPGTVLFLIAGINQLTTFKMKYIHFVVCFFCCILMSSYAILGLTYYNGDGYNEMVRKWKKYSLIKPYSIMLFSYPNMGFHPGLMWYRKDVLFYVVSEETSLAAIKTRYPDRAIYVNKNIMDEGNFVALQNEIKEKISNDENVAEFLFLQE